MRVPGLASAIGRRDAWWGAAVVDAVVAVALLAVAVGALVTSGPDASPAGAIVAGVLMAGAVAVRRARPMPAALAAPVGLVGYELATRNPILASPPVALVLTCYTFGRWGPTSRRPARVVLVAGVGLAASWAVAERLSDSPGEAVPSWLATVVAPLAVGLLLARRSRLSQQLSVAAEQLRVEQDHNAAQATAQERNRVARELHDVVAHCVSVMVVQAGAARLVAGQDCAAADRALAVISDCGRDAMTDLRRIVGVLRRADDPAFGRGVGLDTLGPLTDRIQAAGVPTHLSLCGTAQPPPAVDVVAYRVVQEALTNVVKHAGLGATADVVVRMSTDAVTVEVSNTRVAARPDVTPSGHGLVGMRERVTALGGDLRVGPRPDGGYGVRAQLPYHPRPGTALGTPTPGRGVAGWNRYLTTGLATWLVVAFWFVAMEIEAATSSATRGPWLLNATAVAMMAAAAGWRRRSPLLFLAVVGGLAAALSQGLTSLDRSTVTGLYSLAVPLFSVAAWAPRRRAGLGLALWVTVAGVLAVVNGTSAAGLAGAVVMGLVVWGAGRLWRAQLLLDADLHQTTARLAAERDQRARFAVATERTRIARDLHGPVALAVTTMVVRAEAARHLLGHRPGDAEAAIQDIEVMGRDALAQLRRILGVLRTPTAVLT